MTFDIRVNDNQRVTTTITKELKVPTNITLDVILLLGSHTQTRGNLGIYLTQKIENLRNFKKRRGTEIPFSHAEITFEELE